MRAWRHAEVYEPARGGVAPWLLTIARNVAIDARRMRRTVPVDPSARLFLERPSDEAGPDEPRLGDDEARRVRAAIAALPAEQRRALVLAALCGRTALEISGDRAGAARDDQDEDPDRDAEAALPAGGRRPVSGGVRRDPRGGRRARARHARRRGARAGARARARLPGVPRAPRRACRGGAGDPDRRARPTSRRPASRAACSTRYCRLGRAPRAARGGCCRLGRARSGPAARRAPARHPRAPPAAAGDRRNHAARSRRRDMDHAVGDARRAPARRVLPRGAGDGRWQVPHGQGAARRAGVKRGVVFAYQGDQPWVTVVLARHRRRRALARRHLDARRRGARAGQLRSGDGRPGLGSRAAGRGTRGRRRAADGRGRARAARAASNPLSAR